MLRLNVELYLRVARRVWIGLRQNLGKAIADDSGHFPHEVSHFLPFVRQQILFELRMNGPLSLDPRAFSTNQYTKQFHVPGCRLRSARLWLITF